MRWIFLQPMISSCVPEMFHAQFVNFHRRHNHYLSAFVTACYGNVILGGKFFDATALFRCDVRVKAYSRSTYDPFHVHLESLDGALYVYVRARWGYSLRFKRALPADTDWRVLRSNFTHILVCMRWFRFLDSFLGGRTCCFPSQCIS